MRPVKSLPSEKRLNCPPPRCLLYNLVQPGGNVTSLIFPYEFLNHTPMVFGINPDVLLRQPFVLGRFSSWLREYVVAFSRNVGLNILVKKNWFLLIFTLVFTHFYLLFMVRRELHVAFLTISLNEFKKETIKLLKPEVCPCRMCKAYIACVSFIWFYMHIEFILTESKSWFV